MDFEFSTYYKSLTTTHRVDEEYIINKAIEEGIIPVDLRYDVFNGSYRGVIKSSNDMLYYFVFVPDSDNLRLIKADDPSKLYEATKVLKNCVLGCSMVKAGEVGGTGQQTGGIGVRSEEDNISDQDELITDVHPGAAGVTTPDDPAQGRMWHEEQTPVMGKSWDASVLLDSLNDTLRKSTEQLRRPVSLKEKEFMLEVMGKTPGQISSGDTYMSPTHKVLYQQWLGKSMNTKIDDLSKWLKK